jgi:hypothetical protein
MQRRKLRQTAIAAAHQRIATPHQPAHTSAQGAVGVPVGGDGIHTKQPFGHLAQGRTRQGRVQRLQGVHFQKRQRRAGPRSGAGRHPALAAPVQRDGKCGIEHTAAQARMA